MPFVACDVRLGETSVSPLGQIASETRSLLGLPTDQALIATGHLPNVPHAGILAKYIAAQMLAEKAGGCVVNLVIDTGLEAVGQLEVPIGNAPADLSVAFVSMLEECQGVLAIRPAARPVVFDVPQASAEVRAALETIQLAWPRSEGRTASEQAACMVSTLLQEHAPGMASVSAAGLLETPLGLHMLDAIRHDPRACVEAYNTAAKLHPGVCKVLDTSGDIELPLWVVTGQTRRAAYVADLDSPANLQPRALVNTAIMRGSVADLFIHGTGGWLYDEIMESWMQNWLQWQLSPRLMVSGTVRLPQCDDASIQSSLANIRDDVRRERHDPAGAVGQGQSREKKAWLAELAALPRGSDARRAAFQEMHKALHAAGDRNAVDHLSAARVSAKVASRRDWAFPLCSSVDINHLTSAIRAELSEVEVPSFATAE
ncbi:MAG: hypothetical protein P8I91_07970 [Phycisphaerales bacterium]|nr:hypothetical protein [Phycisphaerales bacterium]